jgi:hypothetical protein
VVQAHCLGGGTKDQGIGVAFNQLVDLCVSIDESIAKNSRRTILWQQ